MLARGLLTDPLGCADTWGAVAKSSFCFGVCCKGTHGPKRLKTLLLRCSDTTLLCAFANELEMTELDMLKSEDHTVLFVAAVTSCSVANALSDC